MQKTQYPSSMEFQCVNVLCHILCGDPATCENNSKLKHVVDCVSFVLYSLMYIYLSI